MARLEVSEHYSRVKLNIEEVTDASNRSATAGAPAGLQPPKPALAKQPDVGT